MNTSCPHCSAPLKHYNNSDGSSTDYCEYCNYRYDYPIPERSFGSQMAGITEKALGKLFRTSFVTAPKKSPIDIMDEEKAQRANKQETDGFDPETGMYRKAGKRQKVFDPETGTYR